VQGWLGRVVVPVMWRKRPCSFLGLASSMLACGAITCCTGRAFEARSAGAARESAEKSRRPPVKRTMMAIVLVHVVSCYRRKLAVFELPWSGMCSWWWTAFGAGGLSRSSGLSSGLATSLGGLAAPILRSRHARGDP